jgi:propanol-preferring alcohol dehydrogenase
MLAMLYEGQPGKLRRADLPEPTPGPRQVLLRVQACAVCRTDLHLVDGELARPKLPVIPGHEIVGVVADVGPGVERFRQGDRVGVPWLGWTCGACTYCRSGRENLCDDARFTGYDVNGGFTEMTVADERFCFGLPKVYSAIDAAPLLCAGLIGYRALRATAGASSLGLYGFGAAAHIVTQVARHEGRAIFAFTRAGDVASQDFARELGAAWAGSIEDSPPAALDAAIVFAPVGAIVPLALRAVRKGGTVVCAGIHMSDIPSFPYEILWGERLLRSVANLTRRDGMEFLELAPLVPVRAAVAPYPLARAAEALDALRSGRVRGAAVLVPPTA